MAGLGLSIPEVAGRSRRAPDPAPAAQRARMTAPPDPARAALIDAAVRALKASGVWAKLDLLYCLAAHDAQAARLNWIGASFNLAAVNSPAFTADRGYAGDGATSYLATGWNPSASAVGFALNGMSLGAWLNAGTESSSGTAVALGCASAGTGATLIPRGGSNRIMARANSSGTASSTGSVATRTGFSAVSRRDGASAAFHRGAALDGVISIAAAALPNSELFLCGMSSTGSFVNGVDNRIAAAFAGAGLDAAEMAALHAAFSAYLTGVGGA